MIGALPALVGIVALRRNYLKSEPGLYDRQRLRKLFLEFAAVRALVQSHEDKHGAHTVVLVRRAEAIAQSERSRARKNRLAQEDAHDREKNHKFYAMHRCHKQKDPHAT